jgi:hypothetical protein
LPHLRCLAVRHVEYTNRRKLNDTVLESVLMEYYREFREIWKIVLEVKTGEKRESRQHSDFRDMCLSFY